MRLLLFLFLKSMLLFSMQPNQPRGSSFLTKAEQEYLEARLERANAAKAAVVARALASSGGQTQGSNLETPTGKVHFSLFIFLYSYYYYLFFFLSFFLCILFFHVEDKSSSCCISARPGAEWRANPGQQSGDPKWQGTFRVFFFVVL